MTVSKPTNLITTLLALLNGQFGGSIMVLPILALQVGWIPILIIVFITVVINWYSCHLVLLHLGNENAVGKVVTHHFKNNNLAIKVYNLATALGLLTACMVYFKLITIQIEGLFLNNEHSNANVLINGFLIILWLISTKCWDIDTHVSGYGFFSIAAFFVFLLWAWVSSPSGKDTSLPTFGT